MLLFIDFKEAYDTILREAFWDHLHRIRMPSSLLNIVKDPFADDAYILVDGPMRVRALPTRGVKQGCLPSPLLFSLHINDIDPITGVLKEQSLALATYGSPICYMQVTCALLQIGQTKCKPYSIVKTHMPR